MTKKEKKVPDPRLVVIGQRIRAVRQAKGLTMEQVVEAADFSTQFLSKIEKGEQSMTVLKLASLAKALGVSSDYLLFGREGRSEPEALLLELLEQLPPVDRLLLTHLFGTAGGLLNAIRPNLKCPDAD